MESFKSKKWQNIAIFHVMKWYASRIDICIVGHKAEDTLWHSTVKNRPEIVEDCLVTLVKSLTVHSILYILPSNYYKGLNFIKPIFQCWYYGFWFSAFCVFPSAIHVLLLETLHRKIP